MVKMISDLHPDNHGTLLFTNCKSNKYYALIEYNSNMDLNLMKAINHLIQYDEQRKAIQYDKDLHTFKEGGKLS